MIPVMQYNFTINKNYRFCCICQLALSRALLVFETAVYFDNGFFCSLAIRFCCRFCSFQKLLHSLHTSELSLRIIALHDLLI